MKFSVVMKDKSPDGACIVKTVCASSKRAAWDWCTSRGWTPKKIVEIG